MTQLMTLILIFFTLDHHTDLKDKRRPHKPSEVIPPYKEGFLALTKLAAWGMESTPVRLTFSEEDIESEGIEITQKELDFGLLTSIKEQEHPIFGTSEEHWQFMHLVIQEYLAGIHWLSYPWSKIEALLANMKHGQYDMLVMFFFGLLVDDALHKDLKNVFPEGVTHESCEEKSKALINMIQTFNMAETKEGRLFMLMVLYQGQQPAMVREAGRWVISASGELDLRMTSMTSVESHALGFFLQHTTCSLDSLV